MAKFTSYDGIDAQGTRAEVMVQTGSGRVKELVGRGKPSDDGSYRNVEVVFDPDNPLLKRKVYALLDTTAKELWEYVQAAEKDGRTVSYRIESQRKRGVDRKKKFEDLVHTEEVVRILAAVDTVFSHEAKTNPKEDPSGINPSALEQDLGGGKSVGNSSISAETALSALAQARQAGLSDIVIDTLTAHALAAGVPMQTVLTAGFSQENEVSKPETVRALVAYEEKPWVAYNSDGRINVGSYLVQAAARAEQFALDHLVRLYTPSNAKSPVSVSDEMIAQAAAAGKALLDLADEVQSKGFIASRPDRMKFSYARALDLVLDAVDKRYSFPIGGNEEARTTWHDAVLSEASERLYGICEIAQGNLPKPEAERNVTSAPAPAPIKQEAPATPRKTEAANEAKAAGSVVNLLQEALGGEVISGADSSDSTFNPGNFPKEGEAGFVAPGSDLTARLRDLCDAAQVLEDVKSISNWMERVLGVRAARKVHAPVLEAFCDFYEAAGPMQVRSEVLGANV